MITYLEELEEKVSSSIYERTIRTLAGRFSVWKKSLVLVINDVEVHDISSFVPEDVWRMGTNGDDSLLNNPVISHAIKCEISKIANKYAKDFDPNFSGSIVLR